jgi:acyl-CoA synthetase (AMP-forming)/AMP-acid ligase II
LSTLDVIHAHFLDRAARYFPERLAVSSGATRLTFGELHRRVARVAATLSRHGLAAGDRLALLLPNEVDYLELVYACAWLGVIVVPLNTRFSAVEIDRVLADAGPRGLIRHSALPAPTVPVPWQRVLDKQPFELQSGSCPEAIYDPDAVLALIYTSGTTGHPKGVMLTHAATLANVDHLNYWMPYHEGGVYLHAAPLFHIADVMRGYWNNREETLNAFRNGLFRTGDVGYQDAEGYLYILDRVKDMIVTGGENVYSGEVEAVLYEHPAVREAAVFGIPDAKWGELVMAYVVLKPGVALSVDELIEHCRRSLASYKVPRRVEFSDLELPKTGSGKILKRALRERFWAHQSRAVS